MAFGRKSMYFFVILAVLCTMCADEVEGRRKILRGRKTLTRTYFQKIANKLISISNGGSGNNIVATGIINQCKSTTEDIHIRISLIKCEYLPNDEMAIPAWAVILLVGIAEIIAGAGLYVALRKIILSSPLTGTYHVAPTEVPVSDRDSYP